jgi:hypothetical protein
MVSCTELFFEHDQINRNASRQAGHATTEVENKLQKSKIRWTLKAKPFCDANYLALSWGNSASSHEEAETNYKVHCAGRNEQELTQIICRRKVDLIAEQGTLYSEH